MFRKMQGKKGYLIRTQQKSVVFEQRWLGSMMSARSGTDKASSEPMVQEAPKHTTYYCLLCSFGQDFVLLIYGSILRDLGVTSLIIIRGWGLNSQAPGPQWVFYATVCTHINISQSLSLVMQSTVTERETVWNIILFLCNHIADHLRTLALSQPI